MSEYYAVERTGSDLAHYGVKGMKWGVQKAVASGDTKAINKQFKKASKKLNKLKTKADTNAQTKLAISEKKKAFMAGADTALAGALSLGTVPKDRIAHVTTYIGGPKSGRWDHVIHDTVNLGKSSSIPHYIAGAATAQGIARTAYHTGKAIAAKRRANPQSKVHTKAAAKATEFQNEMRKAFAGTKYANKVGNSQPEKKKERKYFTKDDFKTAGKAALLSPLMGPMAINYTTSKKIANEIPANNNRHRKAKKRR